MKKLLAILTISLLTLAGAAQQSQQDVIYLKNGTVVRGKIVEQLPDHGIKVYTSNRTMVEFKADEIDKMEKEKGGEDLIPQADVLPLTKGNMIIGGSAAIDYQKTKYDFGMGTNESHRFLIGIYPLADYFIDDNLAIGGKATISLTTGSGTTNFNIGVGPEIRYYLDNMILLKAETSLVYGTHDKDFSISIKPGVGYAIFLNSKVALEPCLIYEFNSETWKSNSTDYKYRTNRFGIEVGLVVFL
jgi:hypothetical protein